MTHSDNTSLAATAAVVVRRVRPRWALLAAVAVVVLAADQLTKRWALNTLQGEPPIHVVGSLRFNLAFNSGAAFSLGPGKGQILAVVVLGIAAAVLWGERKDPTRLGAIARGMIVGGAAGNLTDRLFRAQTGFLSGRVVDFIDFQWWPVFNVADAAVVVGAILLGVNMLFQSRGE